jgi:hypothetical protein
VLALVLLGLTGLTAELLLLGHYEDSWQFVPFAAIVLAFCSLGLHGVAPGPVTIRAVQAVMALLVVVGLAGMVLHYRGNMEFQLDIDPGQSAWTLFIHVVRAKAPPALAPGAMSQLGLLGLAYAWRHPSAGSGSTSQGE